MIKSSYFYWRERGKNPSSRAYFLRVGLMFALLSRVRMFELMILVKSNVFVHLRALNGVTGKTMVRGRAILPTRELNHSQSVLETATLN